LVFDDDDNGDDSYEEEVLTCTVIHSGPERDMKKFITSISVCVLVVNRDWLWQKYENYRYIYTVFYFTLLCNGWSYTSQVHICEISLGKHVHSETTWFTAEFSESWDNTVAPQKVS
jgi:hypothetical protein